jgi:hemin uptake protein HemP
MTTATEERRYTSTSSDTLHEVSEKKVRVLVSELLQGEREATLVHDGKDYRLRITANGKLILTK